jgi:hypothetical protein
VTVAVLIDTSLLCGFGHKACFLSRFHICVQSATTPTSSVAMSTRCNNNCGYSFTGGTVALTGNWNPYRSWGYGCLFQLTVREKSDRKRIAGDGVCKFLESSLH